MRALAVAGMAAAFCLFIPGCRFLHRNQTSKPAAVVIENVDLNTGSERKIERLPGITPSIAKQIVAGRPYANPQELVERNILTERELERILDHVTVETAR